MSTSLVQFYEPKKKRTVVIPMRLFNELRPKIVDIVVGKYRTKLKMAPEWFKPENQSRSLKHIVYPKGTTEQQQHTFDTVARYRAVDGKPNNNFRDESLKPGENNTEVMVIALDQFVQQFGGQLNFTDENVSFEEATHRAACGVANLSSAHLLATDFIPTANFTFNVALDYQTDLARTSETMQDFVLSFSNSIANQLNCPADYVRVIAVEKPGKTRRQTKVKFGISTPNRAATEELAEELKIRAKKGFPKDRILKYVKPAAYDCKWMPLINYFQLSPSDFAPEFNMDYTADKGTEQTRGGLPYFLPVGWFRHALKVVDKFPDDQHWLGSSDADGEWAVAFHGTHGGAVKGIKDEGLRITAVDAKRKEAVEEKGEYFDKPGLYVATHCTGGSHPQYTKTFTVPSSNGETESFRVVFQCRVNPDVFTAHSSPVSVGEAWRFVDSEAIRPYGILVKNEETPDIYP